MSEPIATIPFGADVTVKLKLPLAMLDITVLASG
jgi:hypothetical protein